MKYKALAASLVLVTSVAANASSHREAPYITGTPQVDATDFYMFSSYEPGRENYVTMIANYIPVQAAYGGPNYFPLDVNALYEIHIDNDGDAKEDLSFVFDISNTLRGGVVEIPVGNKSVTSVLKNIGAVDMENKNGLSHLQRYRIGVATGHNPDQRDRGRVQSRTVTEVLTEKRRFDIPFDYSGTKTFGGPGGYADYAEQFIYDIDIPNCPIPGRVFVGQRYEAFKISLGEVFDLVNFVPIDGDEPVDGQDGDPFPGGVTQDPARNTLAKNNVTTIALEVPKACLTGSSDVIGAWTTASVRRTVLTNPSPSFQNPARGEGAWVQVSRLGMPLVNELVIGYDKKNLFNSSHPSQDGQFADFVTNPVLPEILNILFLDPVNDTLGTEFPTLAPTNFPRLDLVTAFLTGIPGVNSFEGGQVSEMLRLNTGIQTTMRGEQNPLGVIEGDSAGFPNGRRPGDDVVDIALRVVMGKLCHLPLGVCDPADANVGFVPFTDGAPLSAMDLNNEFPYLLTPYPGSPVNAPLPQPKDLWEVK